jgi:hypothetical protein
LGTAGKRSKLALLKEKQMAQSRFHDFFRTVAGGGTPTKADLEREGFRAGDRRAVRIQVAAIHVLREDGNNGGARRKAQEFADHWQERFDADVNWRIEPQAPEPADDDAAGLAALVPRRGGM